MDIFFITQLLISFLIGGSIIAVLSFAAEKANAKTAGIILSLPSTVVVSFLFIGWVTSAQAVSDIAPTAIATDGSVMIFTVVYMYASRVHLKKIQSIFFSLISGLASWFLLSVPLALYKFDNLLISVCLFISAAAIAYYFLTIKNKNNNQDIPLAYTASQKIGRAVFAGAIICLAVFLSKILHPFWGGIFSSFPAAFTSTFVILHWYYGSDMLFKVGKTVAAGSFVYMPYVLASHWTFPAFGIIGGTITAYAISLAFFFVLWKLQKNVRKPKII